MSSCLGCGRRLDLRAYGNPVFDPEGRTASEKTLTHPPAFPAAIACLHCRLVQVPHAASPTAVADANWTAAELTRRCDLMHSSRVLELAGGDGPLLQSFRNAGMSVLCINPVKNTPTEGAHNPGGIWNRCFGPDLVPDILRSFGPVDLIIANHLFARAASKIGFFSAVRQCLAPGGTVVLEFPHIFDLLDSCGFDTIYHEDVFYYSVSAVSDLGVAVGLHAFDADRQDRPIPRVRVFLGRTVRRASTELMQMLKSDHTQGLSSHPPKPSLRRKTRVSSPIDEY